MATVRKPVKKAAKKASKKVVKKSVTPKLTAGIKLPKDVFTLEASDDGIHVLVWFLLKSLGVPVENNALMAEQDFEGKAVQWDGKILTISDTLSQPLEYPEFLNRFGLAINYKISVVINDEYDVDIDPRNKEVTVGCTTIDFDTMDEVISAYNEAKANYQNSK